MDCLYIRHTFPKREYKNNDKEYTDIIKAKITPLFLHLFSDFFVPNASKNILQHIISNAVSIIPSI